MNKSKLMIIFGLILLIIGLFDSAFIINQGEQAIVLQFGKIVSDKILEPGLQFKTPFINKVVFFEKKILGFSSELREAIASDQKRVLVDTYTKYRIVDPLLFYQSVRTEQNLAMRISPIVESAAREAIAKVSLNCFVSECRNRTIQSIKTSVISGTKSFGVEIVDVRVKTVGLPGENLEAVFSRMKTDRTKEAKQKRAEGFEQKSIITSKADKESAFILSDAQLVSAKLRGKADATAAKIYNDAFAQDLEYFQYLRYIETYKKTLKSKDTVFLLNEENDYLKFLLKSLNYNHK